MDRKTLIDADSSSNYEMDFQAIVNIEFGSKRIHSTNVNFWGLNFHYDETGVHPANYILIQGIAYFEQKESKWVLKNFEVSKAEAINSEKIPN
jgi:hypothetical protein